MSHEDETVPRMSGICVWQQDGAGEDHYDTTCRHRFSLYEGSPRENKMAFCCYCGNVLEEHLDTEEEDE